MADTAWIRFDNVAIPAYSRIRAAHVVVKSYEDLSSVDANATCSFVDADDPAAPTTQVQVDGYARTTGVEWTNLEQWTDDFTYRSPNLASDLQEIIDRAGWASGNAVIFLAEDNLSDTDANRFFSAIDFRSGAEQARLCVSWVPPPTLRAPEISPESGIYYHTVTCSMVAYPTDVTIRYTTDGSDPTPASPVYSAPFDVTSDMTVKARSYREYAVESEVASVIYDFQASLYFCPAVSEDDGWVTWEISDDRPNWVETPYSYSHGDPGDSDEWWMWVSELVLKDYSDVFHHYLSGIWARFGNINIPQGASIISATASFYVWPNGGEIEYNLGIERNDVKLYFVEADNAVAPADGAEFLALDLDDGINLSIDYNYPIGIVIAGNKLNSIDVTAQLQAIINRPGWASGNAVMMVIRKLPYPVDNPFGAQTFYANQGTFGYRRRLIQWDHSQGYFYCNDNISGFRLSVYTDSSGITTTSTTTHSTTTTTTV